MSDRSGRGQRGRGRKQPDCRWYRLLGKCDGESTGKCKYTHKNKGPSYSETVDLPEKISLDVGLEVKGQNLKLLTNIAECCITSAGPRAVMIVTSDEKQLPRLVETYKLILSQLVHKYPMEPRWCYLHHDGVSKCLQGTLFHFRTYEGRLPPRPSPKKWMVYELCTNEEGATQEATLKMEKLIAKSPTLMEHDRMEGAYQEIEKAYGASAINHKKDKELYRMRMVDNHRDHMSNILKGGLQWLCDKRKENSRYVAKLEARLGKVLWGNLPEEVTSCGGDWGIETLTSFLVSDENHKQIFNTEVSKESADNIHELLEDESCSVLETYDIKFTDMQSDGGSFGERLDVKVKFVHGQPKVILVKKNEVKTLVFDLICLHRNQDIRMTLNHYELVKPEYNTVNHFIRTLTLSDPGECTIRFVPRTEDWNVHFIRHKKSHNYVLDNKYMVTVSLVRECAPDWSSARNNKPLDVTPGLYNVPHTEIEFHNIAWECAFGRDAGYSPEQLAVRMEQSAIEPSVSGAIPHPWQPEHILEDFEEVWEQLDTLNGRP